MSQAAAERWLKGRGWRAFAFQRAVWRAMAQGQSGLLHATTGAGKTLAVWLGALARLAGPAKKTPPPLTVLWLTPMRALAADTLAALREPMAELAPGWSSGLRSGDTSAAERAAQAKRLPTLLVTTPESLSLMLSRADAQAALASVQLVVVDEWHELLGSKRGVQVQLALARLAQWQPTLLVWGLSATIGNLQEALDTLLPTPVATPTAQGAAPPLLVQGKQDKTLVIDTLLPPRPERFTWAGHLGLHMRDAVVAALDESPSTLVFTNTRSQAELWYQALLDARPDWAGLIALHHGSLAHEVRQWVEAGMKGGTLKAVVCTSSLDLGVDFLPVERVLQIGSAKGVARLAQRAGRSGHAPGRASRITLVPTHTLELLEAAALRAAVQAGAMEARQTPEAPLDVLVQHLVTVGLGGGFTPDALKAEVRSCRAYAGLSDEAWQWALDFVTRGGESLTAYPDFHRVVAGEDGVWRVPDARLARRHRSNIGTIVADASMQVQLLHGARLGAVEEGFIARLKPGAVFAFAGRQLELVRIEQMTAWVKKASGQRAIVPRWGGGRMPLSDVLAKALLAQFAAAARGQFDAPELRAAKPLLELQAQWSALPEPGLLLAEAIKSREGHHLFVYPFAGRQVHLGLAGLMAWRAGQTSRATFSIAVNDYGFELLSATAFDWASELPRLLSPIDGAGELLASLNASELARRRFREIARIAGLVFQSHPGERRSQRQVQASSNLYFDVFRSYDPTNQLLAQAQAEVLAQELDLERLQATLAEMAGQRLHLVAPKRATPMALPLMVERFREQLSTETLGERLQRLVAQLKRAADA